MSKLEERKERVREIRQSSKLPSAGEDLSMVGGTIVAEKLGPQLGSDATALTKGEFDMRRLSILNEPLQAAIAYFSWRGGGQQYNGSEGGLKIRKGVRFWRHIVEQYLNTSPSIGGVGRRQLIEMQRATTPGAPMEPLPEKPGLVARNLWNRDWKEKKPYE